MSKIVKISNGDYKLQVKSGGQIILDAGNPGVVTISSTTASVNQSTGALQVKGGVGITGDVHMGQVLQLQPSAAAPTNPTAGMIAMADRLNWNPCSKGPTTPYLVFYDGVTWYALY
jgi:hypothetical protein